MQQSRHPQGSDGVHSEGEGEVSMHELWRRDSVQEDTAGGLTFTQQTAFKM